MRPAVYCVLRQSAQYGVEQVRFLARQVAGQARLIVVGDNAGADIPLRYGWPGWWAKMELCRPGFEGDLLYMDLDTVVLGDLAPFFRPRPTTLLSDFYRPALVQSSVMYLTEEDRRTIWERWIADPAGHIARYSVLRPGFNGDQNFIGDVLGHAQMSRWQEDPTTPVYSFKTDVLPRGGAYPRDGLLIFHGKPRPWHVEPWKDLVK